MKTNINKQNTNYHYFIMYLWLKALHLIALVAWFSALFYLPRLFVYHTEVDSNNQEDSIHYNRFCTMEYKLYNYIMTPAAVVTSVLGLWLLFTYSLNILKVSGWLHTKLSLVLLLWGYHLYCGRIVKKFQERTNKHSGYFYRVYNEIPTLFLISIVILAVVKPF